MTRSGCQLSVSKQLTTGSWQLATDVRLTPFPLRVQLPRRGFDSRGIDRGVREPGNAGDGITRSRRSVRLAPLPSRRKKGGDQGAHWGGSDVRCVFTTETPFRLRATSCELRANWLPAARSS